MTDEQTRSVLLMLLGATAALGSCAAAGRSAVPGAGDGGFQPLAAPVRGAVPMSMAEFVTRAVRDPDQSLAGVRVRLVGFVAPGDGAGYRLTRFVIFCCAADAEALQAGGAGPGRARTATPRPQGPGPAGRVGTRRPSARPARRPSRPRGGPAWPRAGW
jgi:hypothetical protein